METRIVLLRGINVGGRSLPMATLVEVLEKLGARDVRTYIQSGNAVFRGTRGGPAAFAARLSAAIGETCGFEPEVLVLPLGAVERAMANNPFPDAVDDPGHLHLGFLARTPLNPDTGRLNALKVESERFALAGDVFYLHAPDGVGRSKLAAGAERALGVPMTDRNWRTVRKLKEMAED